MGEHTLKQGKRNELPRHVRQSRHARFTPHRRQGNGPRAGAVHGLGRAGAPSDGRSGARGTVRGHEPGPACGPAEAVPGSRPRLIGIIAATAAIKEPETNVVSGSMNLC